MSSSEEKLPLNSLDEIPGVNYQSVSVPERNGEAKGSSFDARYPFDETFDRKFWEEVNRLFEDGLPWSNAMATARSNAICKRYIQEGKDPLVMIITYHHDKFIANASADDHYPTFVHELSQFAELILQADFDSEKRYSKLLSLSSQEHACILYLAAERNLVQIVQSIINFYPGTMYLDNHVVFDGSDSQMKALEIALHKKSAGAACVLLDNMANESVRDLFQDSEDAMAAFKLQDFIKDPEMKPVLLGVLSCLITDDWPFTPVNQDETRPEEHAWTKMPNAPMRYHVFYRILDGDAAGRPPSDPDFDSRAPSCLQLIANSQHCQQDAAVHPAVRLLVERKWELYGSFWTKLYFFMYLLFLLAMSLALLTNEPGSDPAEYSTNLDYVRGICEVLTLGFTLFYVVEEVDQIIKERILYFCDWFNLLDVAGLLLLLVLVPLRFAQRQQEELAVAAAAYLINFMRVFKFFPAYETMSMYAKTFAQIIRIDIRKFAGVFLVVMMAFLGSVYLALRAAANLSDIGSFASVLLQEVRALAESQAFADNYSKLNVGVTVLIMVNMLSIMVIMSNILIGQISYRYAKAQELARIQNHIDRTKLVTKIENSRFLCLNKRVKYYAEGDFVEEAYIQRLRTEWEQAQASLKAESDSMPVKKYTRSIAAQRKSPCCTCL